MPPGLPTPKGQFGWDDLTAVQQSHLLAYDQISEFDQSDREIALAGGKSKPKSTGMGKGRGS